MENEKWWIQLSSATSHSDHRERNPVRYRERSDRMLRFK